MTSESATTDIGTRVLALLGGLHGPGDLAPDRIEHATGIPVEHDPEDPHRYGFGASVDSRWACHLASIPDRFGGPPKRLVFSYDHVGDGDGDVPASAPEFDGFARALRDAGYAQDIIHGPRGAIWGHRFVRGEVEVRVDTEREDAQAAEIRFQVSRVTIDTSGVGHG